VVFPMEEHARLAIAVGLEFAPEANVWHVCAPSINASRSLNAVPDDASKDCVFSQTALGAISTRSSFAGRSRERVAKTAQVGCLGRYRLPLP
jgi:hypothetical protein